MYSPSTMGLKYGLGRHFWLGNVDVASVGSPLLGISQLLSLARGNDLCYSYKKNKFGSNLLWETSLLQIGQAGKWDK